MEKENELPETMNREDMMMNAVVESSSTFENEKNLEDGATVTTSILTTETVSPSAFSTIHSNRQENAVLDKREVQINTMNNVPNVLLASETATTTTATDMTTNTTMNKFATIASTLKDIESSMDPFLIPILESPVLRLMPDDYFFTDVNVRIHPTSFTYNYRTTLRQQIIAMQLLRNHELLTTNDYILTSSKLSLKKTINSSAHNIEKFVLEDIRLGSPTTRHIYDQATRIANDQFNRIRENQLTANNKIFVEGRAPIPNAPPRNVILPEPPVRKSGRAKNPISYAEIENPNIEDIDTPHSTTTTITTTTKKTNTINSSMSVRKSGRTVNTPRYNKNYSYDEPMDEDEEESEDEDDFNHDDDDDDDFRASSSKKKRKQKSYSSAHATKKKVSRLAIGQMAEAENNGTSLWSIETILAVRYADLPLRAQDIIERDTAKAQGYTEDELDTLADRQQLAIRLEMPKVQRRAWNSLEYLVKFRARSYLHCEWVKPEFMRELHQQSYLRRITLFLDSNIAQEQLDEEEAYKKAGKEPRSIQSYLDEDWITIERILARKNSWETIEIVDKETKQLMTKQEYVPMYLVKFKGLPYASCTWESGKDINDDTVIAQFEKFNTIPSTGIMPTIYVNGYDVRGDPRTWKPFTESPIFRDGRTLRTYQIEGLNWLIFNWWQRRNCILADEMGLGKTIQTIAMLEYLYTKVSVRGPFLVVVPLSTLHNWKREFDTWSSMNCVVYYDAVGGAEARQLIREHEFFFPGTAGIELARRNIYKFNVLLIPFTCLTSDWEILKKIRWRYAIVDEAHATKNFKSLLGTRLREFSFDSLLLLTGTPLQNDMSELWTLLNLLDPQKYADSENFLTKYGDLRTAEQVATLQSELEPIMLRRLKEDVEKSIPAKEETIIHVELTRLQKAYYRAVLDRNRTFLSRGNLGNPNLINIEMELRKACNHPYLIAGVETRESSGPSPSGNPFMTREEQLQTMIDASGKTVLLDKLFPKLYAEGHRVLIFSQFIHMLDLIEELLHYRGYKFERIDGSVSGNARQVAIDRFNKPGSPLFAFLLSTKAGGQGINLTSADTVIIYDSDWNPQNDVQAMARAHRIGQTKDVSIYRLITTKTYEADMFKRAGLKLGLSQAVFEGIGRGFDVQSATDNSSNGRITDENMNEMSGSMSGLLSMDRDSIEKLLKVGYYELHDEEESNKSTAEFLSSSIDQILSKSTIVRYEDKKIVDITAKEHIDTTSHATSSSSSSATTTTEVKQSQRAPGRINLSRANFAANETDKTIELSDPAFWDKVLGPRPAQLLLQRLEKGDLNTAELTGQFVADMSALLDEMYDAYLNSMKDETHDVLLSVLIQLQTLGMNIPHPFSDAGRKRWIKEMGTSKKFFFPMPHTSISISISSRSLSAAQTRTRAVIDTSNKTKFPDAAICSESLSDFANAWLERFETGSRARTRQMITGNRTESTTTQNTNKSGRKRQRDNDKEINSEDADEMTTNTTIEGDGVHYSSISNIRIRLTPAKAIYKDNNVRIVSPLGPISGVAPCEASRWILLHPEYIPTNIPLPHPISLSEASMIANAVNDTPCCVYKKSSSSTIANEKQSTTQGTLDIKNDEKEQVSIPSTYSFHVKKSTSYYQYAKLFDDNIIMNSTQGMSIYESFKQKTSTLNDNTNKMIVDDNGNSIVVEDTPSTLEVPTFVGNDGWVWSLPPDAFGGIGDQILAAVAARPARLEKHKVTMPAYYFTRTGLSRAEVLEAADLGLSTSSYIALKATGKLKRFKIGDVNLIIEALNEMETKRIRSCAISFVSPFPGIAPCTRTFELQDTEAEKEKNTSSRHSSSKASSTSNKPYVVDMDSPYELAAIHRTTRAKEWLNSGVTENHVSSKSKVTKNSDDGKKSNSKLTTTVSAISATIDLPYEPMVTQLRMQETLQWNRPISTEVVEFEVQPMRIVGIYNSSTSQGIKPNDIRIRPSAPPWMRASLPVGTEVPKVPKYRSLQKGNDDDDDFDDDEFVDDDEPEETTVAKKSHRQRIGQKGNNPMINSNSDVEIIEDTKSKKGTNKKEGKHPMHQGKNNVTTNGKNISSTTIDIFDDSCKICSVNDGFIDNPIVFCDACDLTVHKSCYGIDYIPEGDDPWYCNICKANKNKKVLDISCSLCMKKDGGAFQTISGKKNNWEKKKYVHIVCARFEYGDRTSLTKEVCHNCHNSTGFIVQCTYPLCQNHIHPVCGQRSMYDLSLLFCSEHAVEYK